VHFLLLFIVMYSLCPVNGDAGNSLLGHKEGVEGVELAVTQCYDVRPGIGTILTWLKKTNVH
jgi:hypothetical protein